MAAPAGAPSAYPYGLFGAAMTPTPSGGCTDTASIVGAAGVFMSWLSCARHTATWSCCATRPPGRSATAWCWPSGWRSTGEPVEEVFLVSYLTVGSAPHHAS